MTRTQQTIFTDSSPGKNDSLATLPAGADRGALVVLLTLPARYLRVLDLHLLPFGLDLRHYVLAEPLDTYMFS